LGTFLSAPALRWYVLKSHLGQRKQRKKNINDTWWSKRENAILTLKEGYDEIKNALLDITTAENVKPLAKAKAIYLANKSEKY
jgi:hypothetical protein